MPRVDIRLPSVMEPIVAGDLRFQVEAETLRGALDAAISRHPALRIHLFDETGSFRRHVLCFHNQTNSRWLEGLEGPVKEGDTVTILQAVTGG